MRGTSCQFYRCAAHECNLCAATDQLYFWAVYSVTTENLLYGFSLNTYAKVLIGFSVFLFSMFPTCVLKFNTHDEINDIIEKQENFPVTFTLASLAVIVEINAWFTVIVTNPAQVCPLAEMIADFVIYGLFVIGWFIIITIFLISDCRKADERKR